MERGLGVFGSGLRERAISIEDCRSDGAAWIPALTATAATQTKLERESWTLSLSASVRECDRLHLQKANRLKLRKKTKAILTAPVAKLKFIQLQIGNLNGLHNGQCPI